jgi:hypothetical protein
MVRVELEQLLKDPGFLVAFKAFKLNLVSSEVKGNIVSEMGTIHCQAVDDCKPESESSASSYNKTPVHS